MKTTKRLIFLSLILGIFLCMTVDVSANWKTVEGKKKYWVKETKSYATSDWYEVDGKFFYFDENGFLKTGRIKVGEDYYYCDAIKGKRINVLIGSYYYGKNGVMIRNQWKKINKKLFYFAKSGKIKYGEICIDGFYYYCDKVEGKIVSLWKNQKYYDENGVMATNCWIGDSYVGENGMIIKGNKNPKNPPSQDDIRLLAAITYLEAGNQSYYGKQCVASVIINRMESSRFPNTLKGVIYQSGQFSPAMDGSLDALYKGSKSIQAQCMKAAEEILTKGSVLKGYYFFNAYYGTLKIGDHYFS